MKQTLTQRVSRLEKTVIRLQELYTHDSERIIKLEQPYTAMRSTGKTAIEVVEAIKRANKYCECAKPMICSALINGSKCGICHYCNKSIKPQEDIREKIANLINTQFDWERWCMHSGKEEYELADKILAIVKGE